MEELLKKAFGISVKIISCKAPEGLPFYMTDGRRFYCLETTGIKSLLIELSESERFGVIAFEKQLRKYVEATGMSSAYVFPSLNKIQRDALTDKGIPFICLPEQVYLPFLGIALNNRFIQEKSVPDQKMTPMTQVLFLYFLYRSGTKAVMKKQADKPAPEDK